MTYVPKITLYCDEPGGKCGEQYTVYCREQDRARVHAAKYGWTRLGRQGDLCPKHKEKTA